MKQDLTSMKMRECYRRMYKVAGSALGEDLTDAIASGSYQFLMPTILRANDTSKVSMQSTIMRGTPMVINLIEDNKRLL